MTETDKDKLISRFLTENRQEIPDNGFSRRVIRRLPDRARKLSLIWSSICTCLGVGVFILFGGMEAALNLFKELISIFGSRVEAINYQYMIIVLLVLGGIGLHKIFSSADL